MRAISYDACLNASLLKVPGKCDSSKRDCGSLGSISQSGFQCYNPIAALYWQTVVCPWPGLRLQQSCGGNVRKQHQKSHVFEVCFAIPLGKCVPGCFHKIIVCDVSLSLVKQFLQRKQNFSTVMWNFSKINIENNHY